MWGNLKFGSLGNRVGDGDLRTGDLLKRALRNNIFEEMGEARLGRRGVELRCSQQLRTWMKAEIGGEEKLQSYPACRQ